MKKIVFLLCATFLSYCSIAVKPPTAVQKAFESKFAIATDVKWNKENVSEYEAEFVMEGVKISANFRADGSWLETETMIPVSKLPSKVQAEIVKLFPNASIIEADRIERAQKETVYEIVVKNGTIKKEIIMDEKGIIQM